MKDVVLILQIIIAVTLIILVLLQAKGTGLGSSFGGSAQVYRSKRGVEKVVVYATIAVVILFFAVSILQIFITK